MNTAYEAWVYAQLEPDSKPVNEPGAINLRRRSAMSEAMRLRDKITDEQWDNLMENERRYEARNWEGVDYE